MITPHEPTHGAPPQISAAEFDAAYYRRFYLRAKTRAMSKPETERRAMMVAGIVAELQLPISRILDMGCGLGWFKRPLNKVFPKAQYVGVEFSEYLCKRHGWEPGSVVDYRGRGQFDLILCCDVLQYLDNAAFTRAVNNLARLSRGAVYIHVPTAGDFKQVIDPSGTDLRVHLRPAQWYREQLRKHFVHVGNGVQVRRGVPFTQWELHEPWR